MFPWFAVQVKFRHEKSVSLALRRKGYIEFVPLYHGRRRVGRHSRNVELPLFPTYVFCRFNPLQRLPILTTPGVVQIVGTGRVPSPIDEEELYAVRAMAESRLDAEPWPFLKVGEWAYVEEGPLRGTSGLLQRTENKDRLVISITLLQRSVAVEVDRTWLRLANERKPAA